MSRHLNLRVTSTDPATTGDFPIQALCGCCSGPAMLNKGNKKVTIVTDMLLFSSSAGVIISLSVLTYRNNAPCKATNKSTTVVGSVARCVIDKQRLSFYSLCLPLVLLFTILHHSL